MWKSLCMWTHSCRWGFFFLYDNLNNFNYSKCDASFDTVRTHPSVSFLRQLFVQYFDTLWNILLCLISPFCCFWGFFLVFKRTTDFETASNANRDFNGSLPNIFFFCNPPGFLDFNILNKDEKRLCSYEKNGRQFTILFFLRTNAWIDLFIHVYIYADLFSGWFILTTLLNVQKVCLRWLFFVVSRFKTGEFQKLSVDQAHSTPSSTALIWSQHLQRLNCSSKKCFFQVMLSRRLWQQLHRCV